MHPARYVSLYCPFPTPQLMGGSSATCLVAQDSSIKPEGGLRALRSSSVFSVYNGP